MKTWSQVAIVGVGLLGGSIGLALRERGLAQRVLGVARRESTRQTALARGCVTETADDLNALGGAEFVVVCTPVADIAAQVERVAAGCAAGALITDVGSTKANIVAALPPEFANGARFVGGHPLAGGEKSGPAHARADLFADKLVIITPHPRSAPSAVERVGDFWRALGARVLQMDAEAHDLAIGAISHLPHLLAAALAAATEKQHLPLTASGWQDTTRVAAGDVETWRQIFADNRRHVLRALGNFEKVLARFRAALERDDQAELVRLLQTGKDHRDAVGS